MAPKLTKFEKMIYDKLYETNNVVHTSVLHNLKLPARDSVNKARVKRHISSIRQKLPKGWDIQSVRGVGYRLVKKKA